MVSVANSGWIAVNRRRKAVRDDVRGRFRAAMGVKPGKTIDDLTFAPVEMVSVVQGLANELSSSDSQDVQEMAGKLQHLLGDLKLAQVGNVYNASGDVELDDIVVESMLAGFFEPLKG